VCYSVGMVREVKYDPFPDQNINYSADLKRELVSQHGSRLSAVYF